MGLAAAVGREWTYASSIARTLLLTRRVHPEARLSITDWSERWARERPDAPAILHRDRRLSWGELDQCANRYARWSRELGLKKGDVVTLLMDNRPEYIAAWLGLVKRGVITALV